MATEYIAGPITFNPKGLWDAESAYIKFDLVKNINQSVYFAIKEVPAGTPLTDSVYWYDMANFDGLAEDVQQVANNAQTVADDKSIVLQAKTDTLTAKDNAKASEVNAKASETNAANSAVSANQILTNVTNVGNTKIADVNNAGDTQTANINTAGAAKLNAVNTAGTTQVNAVNIAGNNKKTEINTAGDAKLNAINSAGAVLYSAQALTDAQKSQSRNNIGAAADADLNAHKDSLDSHPWLFRNKSDLITKSVSGNSLISAADSAGGWIKSLTVFGKSVQDGTPSPDMPIDVQKVSGSLEKAGKNLIPYPYYDTTFVKYGITWTVSSDGVITANGTATANSYFRITTAEPADIPYMPIGNYRLSGAPAGSSTTTYRIYAVVYPATITYNGGDIPVTAGDKVFITLVVNSGQTVTNLVFKPQLELGSVETPYEPYVGTTYASPDLQGIPLGATIPAAISANPQLMAGVYHDGDQYWCGDTCEYAVMSDGVYKKRVVSRMVKKVFDGTESVDLYLGNNGYYISNVLDTTYFRQQGICSHCPVPLGGGSSSEARILLGATNSIIYFFQFMTALNITTIGEFKSWLAAQHAAGTPLTIWYLTNAPTATLSDPIFVDAPKGTANIYHTSAVQPHIEVAYPLDIKAYVDNKVTELTAAIAELSAT